MGTTAIAHLKYDLDNHAVDLKRIATLASAYFIESYQVRREYLREVDGFINDVNRRFGNTFDVNERMRLITEIRAESDLAHREYQILRQGNYTKYIVTEIFEDQGVIKYAKVTGGVLSGLAQGVAGASMLNLGRKLHINRFKAFGLTLVAHGTNNVYESLSPIIYEQQQSGFLRDLYRKGAELTGLERGYGDLAYSTVDFSLTAYSAYRGLVLKENNHRLVSKGLFEKPGTGMLFRNVTKDYRTKWSDKNIPMKIFMVGSSLYKAKVLFVDGKYELNDD